MKVLASINHKGGVGKTTLALTIAHKLALRGHKTLLIDLDGQGNVAEFLGLEKYPGLYRFLFPDVSGPFLFHTNRACLSMIPGEKESTLAAAQRTAAEPFSEQKLARSIRDRLANYGFEFVILDSAPSVDAFHIGALMASDHYLVPVRLNRPSIAGAKSVLTTARSLPGYDTSGGQFMGFVPNFWEQTTRETKTWLEFLHTTFPDLVWPPIPRDTKIREAVSHGRTVWEFCPQARCVTGVKVNRTIDGQKQTATIGGFERIMERFDRVIKNGRV